MLWLVYVCTACGLKIEIGWKSLFFTRSKDPLKRAMKRVSELTFLICKECGGQYMIELAGQWRKCAYMHPVRPHGLPLPDSLFGLNRRIFLKGLPKKSPENYDDSDYEVARAIAKDQPIGWYDCDEWHEINPIETKYNQIVLSKQPCQNCLTIGKIGLDIRTEDACPHCKEKTLKDLTEYFLINPIRFK